MSLLVQAAIFLLAAVLLVPLFQRFGLGAVLGDEDHMLVLGVVADRLFEDAHPVVVEPSVSVHSRIGHICMSLQQNEELASSIGVNIAALRVMAYAISSFLGGLSGLAHEELRRVECNEVSS